MAKVTDPHDLLLYKLGVMLKTEKAIESMLPRLQKEANDPELARGFETHLEQTRQHVANLERAFGVLGEKPQENPAPAIEGLEAEYKGFAASAADDVWPDVLDMVAASSAAATEHHEIAAYEGLVTMAKAMGESKAATLLEKNLKQEQAMLRDGKTTARRLAGKVAKSASDGDSATRATTRPGTGRATRGASSRGRTKAGSTGSGRSSGRGRSSAR